MQHRKAHAIHRPALAGSAVPRVGPRPSQPVVCGYRRQHLAHRQAGEQRGGATGMIAVGVADDQGVEASHTDRPQIGQHEPPAGIGFGAVARAGVEQQVMLRRLHMHGQPLSDVQHDHTHVTGRRSDVRRHEQRQHQRHGQRTSGPAARRQQVRRTEHPAHDRPAGRCRGMPQHPVGRDQPLHRPHQPGGQGMRQPQERIERQHDGDQHQWRDEHADQRNGEQVDQRRHERHLTEQRHHWRRQAKRDRGLSAEPAAHRMRRSQMAGGRVEQQRHRAERQPEAGVHHCHRVQRQHDAHRQRERIEG